DLAGCSLGRRDVVERQAVDQQGVADGTVGQAGVQMRQVVIVGKPARQRALSRCGGTVDGNSERGVVVHQADPRFAPYRWTRPAISASACGSTASPSASATREMSAAGRFWLTFHLPSTSRISISTPT